jgi:hypothetical protein
VFRLNVNEQPKMPGFAGLKPLRSTEHIIARTAWNINSAQARLCTEKPDMQSLADFARAIAGAPALN